MQSALKYIKSLREEEIKNQNNSGKDAEMAMKHLMLYIDTNKLYREALCMYDLEMAYYVITNSQV